MTTHLTKKWWEVYNHKLVEQAIPEAEIYKREWVGLMDKEIEQLHTAWVLGGGFRQLCNAVEAKLKEKNK